MSTPDKPTQALDPALQARFVALYDELQSIAKKQMAGSGPITISPTVLVHEAWLRFGEQQQDSYDSKQAFLAVAAKAMRHVLIDYLRARNAAKRGGEHNRVELLTQLPGENTPAQDLLEIEQALQDLEALDPRLAEMVVCRFYGGMEFSEIAIHQGISERTCQRDWRRARAFIQSRLNTQA